MTSCDSVSQEDIISSLPLEILLAIIEENLSASDIVHLSQTSKQFNQDLYYNPDIWRYLYRRDFGIDLHEVGLEPTTHQSVYQQTMTQDYDPIFVMRSLPQIVSYAQDRLHFESPPLDQVNKKLAKYSLSRNDPQPIVVLVDEYEEYSSILRFLRPWFNIIHYQDVLYMAPLNSKCRYVGLTRSGLGRPRLGRWDPCPIPHLYRTFDKALETIKFFNKQYGTQVSLVL